MPRPTWSEDVCQSYEAYKRDVSARAAREVDVAAIMRYFDTQELTARIFEEMIQENSFVIETERSTIVNPLIAAFCRLVATGIKLANEIGATPMSRVKLGLYAIEGATAQAALEKQISNHAGVDVTVEIEDDAIAVSW
jgi:phage terminase small subunit